MENLSKETKEERNAPDERPPFFESWNTMYVFVIANLGVLIILFYLFTVIYR